MAYHKNVAVIFAAGYGRRMSEHTKPKQFLEVDGKPVLAYTLEHFERHEQIDGIVLVTLPEWIDYCREMAKTWGLDKVVSIVPGGETSQASICRGLRAARARYAAEDIVLIHDGVRPLIDEKTITGCIACVREHGTAITVSPQMESVLLKDEKNARYVTVNRARCRVARAPQCFYLSDIITAQERAQAEGKLEFVDCASLMEHYGHPLHAVDGPDDNIKITTELDFHVFRAILEKRRQPL